jgi:hypothetical protein
MTAIDWRDEALDAIADDYEQNGHPEKADRLRRFLQDAREIAAEPPGLETAGERPRLETYLADRLPEIAQGRQVTTMGPLWRSWTTLTTVFRLERDADQAAGRDRSAADWRPIVERAEEILATRPVIQDDGTSRVLAWRRLDPAERDAVIATPRGVVRAPDEMALRLLWLAARGARAAKVEPLEDFRRQLKRYVPRPVPLTAPSPDSVR